MAGPNAWEPVDAVAYRNQTVDDCAASHFFEKLFRIPRMLTTSQGIKMGITRFRNMLSFMECAHEELLEGGAGADGDAEKLSKNMEWTRKALADFEEKNVHPK